MRSKAPTLEIVAAHAGVSRATVSRVVNGAPTVNPEVAATVQRSIDALGYVPNRAARSLASHRSQSIALVVPETANKVFADPFFASVVQGVATELSPTDYTLNMIIESESQAPKTRRYLMGGNVDGALVISHHFGDRSWESISDTLPVVFGGRPLDCHDAEHYYVDIDNVKAARMGVQRLVDLGRRHVATISGPHDMPPGVDRLRGWRDCLLDAGLEPGPEEQGDFTSESGVAAMERLLATGQPIDGLFAANDQMAVGAYTALRRAGRRVPEDVAVVGFDDSYFSASVDPPLTTVRQPLVGMGAAMARKLVHLIEDRATDRVTILDAHLVVRDSA